MQRKLIKSVKIMAICPLIVGMFLISQCVGHGTSIVINNDSQKGTVVLLHGIAGTSNLMVKIEKRLLAEGYSVVNIDYPSREKSIEEVAELVYMTLKNKGLEDANLYFVTHSMGGLVAHKYITTYNPKNLKRVVMLSPPNQGSEVADWLKNNALYKSFYGKAGQELGTDIKAEPVDFELGVIAGDRSIDPISSYIIPETDDGKVSVERTKINGMNDHIVMHTTHTFIMKNDKVIRQIIYFLENGKFRRKHE